MITLMISTGPQAGEILFILKFTSQIVKKYNYLTLLNKLINK